MSFGRYFAPLVVFLGLVVLLVAGLRLDPREIPSPLIGQQAPDFLLPRLMSSSFEVSTSELLGEVWVLNVWASWCAACREEHQVLHNLVQAVPISLVGLNYKDEKLSAISWLKKFGNPYNQIAVDADGMVGIDWGVYGVPETFVIDASGVVRYKHIGPLSDAVLRKEVLPLLQRLL
ncbi:MAG: DsbE family thiol:disulfide interchange protein [Acidiferrobacteraceae bacterium]|nr:DsbE family thiol:disulfide interchange protein [Acidiferrobacteraceae bacterium]